MKNLVFTIIAVAVVALCGFVAWLAHENVSLHDKLIDTAAMVLKEQNSKNNLKDYVRRNMSLHEAADPDGLYGRFAAGHSLCRDTADHYIVMFPSSGCGSCLSSLCIMLDNMKTDRNRVHIVFDADNKHLSEQLNIVGFKNTSVDSSLFAGMPDFGDIVLLKGNGKRNRFMLFDVPHSEFLKTFLEAED